MKKILVFFFLLISYCALPQGTDTIIDMENQRPGQYIVVRQNIASLTDDTMRYWVKMPKNIIYWGFTSYADTNINDTIYQTYGYAPRPVNGYQTLFSGVTTDTIVPAYQTSSLSWNIMPAEYLLITTICEATTGYYMSFIYFTKY